MTAEGPCGPAWQGRLFPFPGISGNRRQITGRAQGLGENTVFQYPSQVHKLFHREHQARLQDVSVPRIPTK